MPVLSIPYQIAFCRDDLKVFGAVINLYLA
jgi:hypothetical protein